MNEKIILSLGSNVGDRKENINAALSELMSSGFDADSVSSYYETEPVGFKEQDDFINIAVSGAFEGEPEKLIGMIRTIESDLGRVREMKYGPRTIDIDIILFGERKIGSVDLTIPHPEFRNRRFVLVPVCEIEPDAQDPVTGRTVSFLLSECADTSNVSKMSAK